MSGGGSAAASHSRIPRPRSRTELWGILDQSLVSGVNFFTVIILARALSLSEFGYFVLAFTVLQSLGTLQAALVTRPHNVLGAVRRGAAYADYSTTAAAAQLWLTSTFAVCVGTAAGIAYATGFSQRSLVLALVPALVAWQLQELGRRMLYTEGRLAAAFAHDVVSYGTHALLLLVLLQLDSLTGPTALLALGAAFGVDAVLLGVQHRGALAGRFDVDSLRASWRFGKWLGVAEVGQWLSTHFYIYLAGGIIGAVASGALKAGQTLLGPMSVFLTFVTSYLPIVYARDLEAERGLAASTRRSLVTILPVVLAYCALVALFAGPALEAVYGAEYRSYAEVVQLFALYYVVLALSTVAVAALSARRMTRDVFVGHAAGGLLSVTIGWVLLRELGPAGGVAGMLVSWAAAMALFVRALWIAPSGTLLLSESTSRAPGDGV